MEDEVFWDSSLRFIIKQLDLYVEHNSKKDKSKSKKEEVVEYKVLPCEEW